MARKGTGFVPCTPCGGSGAKDEIEIYTDKDGKTKSRRVRVICKDCGGKGGFHV